MQINTTKIKFEIKRLGRDIGWLAKELGVSKAAAYDQIKNAKTLKAVEKIANSVEICCKSKTSQPD